MKIAIIYYSTYGHINHLATVAQQTLKSQGIDTDIFQIPETLSEEVLGKMHAPPKDSSVPEITVDDLVNYDGFVFGIPTRFGNFPAQWKQFWDSTGGLWATGKLYGKPFGIFTSTGGYGAQESTIRTSLSSFVHHGMIYVPLGYGEAFPKLTNLDEVHGGSPWGAGTLAGSDGSRQPSELELDILKIQVTTFAGVAKKLSGPTKTTSEQNVVESVEKPVKQVDESVKQTSDVRQNQLTPTVKENDSFCAKCIIM